MTVRGEMPCRERMGIPTDVLCRRDDEPLEIEAASLVNEEWEVDAPSDEVASRMATQRTRIAFLPAAQTRNPIPYGRGPATRRAGAIIQSATLASQAIFNAHMHEERSLKSVLRVRLNL